MMNDSFGGGFDSTQGDGSGVKSEVKAEGIIPLVIKQINNLPEAGLSFYGMTFGMASIVGIVRSMEHSSTKITFTLEDFTGQIDAHLWLEEGDMANTPSVLLNTYARVHGAVRNQGGVKTLMIFKIESLASINELTTHLLEVINARYMAEDLAKGNGYTGQIGTMPSHTSSTNDYNSNNTNSASDGAHFGLNHKQRLVFEAVRNHGSEQGISLQELQKKFSNIPSSELHAITEFMTNEGHIYTSIDTDHFLPTDV